MLSEKVFGFKISINLQRGITITLDTAILTPQMSLSSTDLKERKAGIFYTAEDIMDMLKILLRQKHR